jgi:hypothetical protein
MSIDHLEDRLKLLHEKQKLAMEGGHEKTWKAIAEPAS